MHCCIYHNSCRYFPLFLTAISDRFLLFMVERHLNQQQEFIDSTARDTQHSSGRTANIQSHIFKLLCVPFALRWRVQTVMRGPEYKLKLHATSYTCMQPISHLHRISTAGQHHFVGFCTNFRPR